MNTKFCCLDASAFSLGFAASHGDTLILEASENVLADYVNSVRPCVMTAPQTDEGRAFDGYLREAGCVSDEGILDTPSLAPAAAEYALNTGGNVLLGTKIISVENNTVRVYTNSGFIDIVCDKIISRPKYENGIRRLNCIISGTDNNTLLKFEKYGGTVSAGFEKDEFIVSLPFAAGVRFNAARIEFVNKIRDCFGTDVMIDAFASDFEYESEFNGIIEEFEAGVNYDVL